MVSTDSIYFLWYIFSRLSKRKFETRVGMVFLPNSPHPDPASQCSSDGWIPYKSHVQFEYADFLYQHNQMSKGDTNHLLNLINVTSTTHGGKMPFHNHHDMCDIIDTTTVSKTPWKHFKLDYETLYLMVSPRRMHLYGWQRSTRFGFMIQ